jgi:hypothetical protein
LVGALNLRDIVIALVEDLFMIGLACFFAAR